MNWGMLVLIKFSGCFKHISLSVCSFSTYVMLDYSCHCMLILCFISFLENTNFFIICPGKMSKFAQTSLVNVGE